jgi:hypothetical protein
LFLFSLSEFFAGFFIFALLWLSGVLCRHELPGNIYSLVRPARFLFSIRSSAGKRDCLIERVVEHIS